jgi:hypothetical protein
MNRIAPHRRKPPFDLPSNPPLPGLRRADDVRECLPVLQRVPSVQDLVLIGRERDVANPNAHRRFRDAQPPSDLGDRETVLTPELSGHVPFSRFHPGKQATRSIGRIQSGRRESNP